MARRKKMAAGDEWIFGCESGSGKNVCSASFNNVKDAYSCMMEHMLENISNAINNGSTEINIIRESNGDEDFPYFFELDVKTGRRGSTLTDYYVERANA